MWLDDDGDDDPGPVPDPSARHWRHPSEIAAENARNAERAMAPAGRAATGFGPSGRSGTGSLLWPITVVGGSIAIAAFGVIGLYLLANSESEITAGGRAYDPGAVGSTLPGSARSIHRQSDGDDLAPFASGGSGRDAEPDSRAEGGVAGPADNDVNGGAADQAQPSENTAGDDDQRPDDDSRPGDGSGDSGAGNGQSDGGDEQAGADQDDDDGGPQSSPDGAPDSRADEEENPAAAALLPSGPAIYATNDLGSEQLASVVFIDQQVISSASALAGHRDVYLLIAGRWYRATVGYTDMASDVAVVLTSGEATVVGGADIAVAVEPIETGSEAFVGYCPSEKVILITTPDDEPSTDVLPATGPAVGRPGCGDGQPRIGSYALPDPEEGSPPQRSAAPKPPNGDGRAEGKPADPDNWSSDQEAKENHPRAGYVFSTDVAARTAADHTIYEPIRTGIRHSDGMAGAPLRDVWGGIVGLVLGSQEYFVSALPIERAAEIAESLLLWGVGSPAWVGIEGRTASTGFVVEAVDEDGPAAEYIKSGDVILSVGGEPLLGQDHFTYLVREAGVGETVQVAYLRPNVGRLNAEIEIITLLG
ncbi:MAG: PDZ domain-containing protein [Acidimicrobiales bacterium]